MFLLHKQEVCAHGRQASRKGKAEGKGKDQKTEKNKKNGRVGGVCGDAWMYVVYN